EDPVVDLVAHEGQPEPEREADEGAEEEEAEGGDLRGLPRHLRVLDDAGVAAGGLLRDPDVPEPAGGVLVRLFGVEPLPLQLRLRDLLARLRHRFPWEPPEVGVVLRDAGVEPRRLRLEGVDDGPVLLHLLPQLSGVGEGGGTARAPPAPAPPAPRPLGAPRG